MSTIISSAADAVRILQEATSTCCDQYFWMTIAAGIFGFFMAFGIGANDVANAFATSVSAKSITLKQAVLIASVCEFLGAMLLGASVTSTIKGKILDTSLYEDEPGTLMYGMLCALVSASFILAVANYLALPVSTTHTIIGSVVGFSLAAKGWRSIAWTEVSKVFISWVAAPVITGIFAVIFFWLTRYFVLRSDEPYARSIKLYPFIIFCAIGLDLFMVFYKAGKNNAQIKEWGIKFMVPCAFAVSLFLAVVFQFFASPYLQRRVEAKVKAVEDAKAEEEAAKNKNWAGIEDMDEHTGNPAVKGAIERTERKASDGFEEEDGKNPAAEKKSLSASQRLRSKAGKSLSASMTRIGKATINRDIEAQAFEASAKAKEMWEAGEDFDLHAEEMFSYLQVLTACLLSFAHGANDVANAIGPIAAVIAIYNTGSVSSKNAVPKWILVLGAVGIVFGLLIYGYRLMISLGYKITKMSASRGFCIELSASTVVVVASFLGIPVSTTQCQVGGTIGVGFLGGSKNLNPLFILKVLLGWVGTFLAVTIINAGVFAFAFYAPSAPGFE